MFPRSGRGGRPGGFLTPPTEGGIEPLDSLAMSKHYVHLAGTQSTDHGSPMDWLLSGNGNALDGVVITFEVEYV